MDEWRRGIYVQQLARDGRCEPSGCSDVPKGKQVICSHPWEALKWGANSEAHYAKCQDCGLKHVVYYDLSAQ